jgi:hypothetical protein
LNRFGIIYFDIALVLIIRGSIGESLIKKDLKRDEIKTGFSGRNIIQVIRSEKI